jgi:hypothetical protein
MPTDAVRCCFHGHKYYTLDYLGNTKAPRRILFFSALRTAPASNSIALPSLSFQVEQSLSWNR